MEKKAAERLNIDPAKTIVKFQVRSRHDFQNNGTGYNVVPVPTDKMSLDEIASTIAEGTTFSVPDCKGAIAALPRAISKGLSHGSEVELKGVGRFRLVLTTKKPITSPTAVRPSDVIIKRISFEPDEELMAHLANIQFKAADKDKYKAPANADEQEQLLSDYFYDHDDIDVNKLSDLLSCSVTTARKRLKVLLSRGRLIAIPHTRTWYKPTPGNFGC